MQRIIPSPSVSSCVQNTRGPWSLPLLPHHEALLAAPVRAALGSLPSPTGSDHLVLSLSRVPWRTGLQPLRILRRQTR